MDNKPKALTKEELNEIAALEEIQQMWGAEDRDDMIRRLRDDVYAVKFHFISGGPGYVGDLFILLGDVLEEPLELIRVKGTLKIVYPEFPGS
jgi:hypothetical protein